MVSRRDVLKVIGTWPLATSGGSSLLLWSSEARAWVPAALAVAQAGFQLYRMSRSGGGGIGKLLAAQVEMLRAINLQLREIAQTMTRIYEGVEQLKDMVEALPQQVIRQMYRAEVQVVSEYGSQLLDNGLINTQTRGIAYAIASDNGASQQVLNRLGPAVNAVIADPSVLNVPLMCLAWYTQYQLLTRYVPFNPGQIATTAKLYQGYFERNISKLTSELAKVDTEVDALIRQISASPTFEDASCFEDVTYRMRSRSCGHDGDFGCYTGHVTATSVSYGSKAELPEEGLAEFLIGAGELEAAGVKISDALLSARVPKWSYSRAAPTRTTYKGRETEPAGYQGHVSRVTGNMCTSGRTARVASYHRVQDEVKRQADSLRLRALVNNHLLLAASEALKSCQTIAQRVSSLQA